MGQCYVTTGHKRPTSDYLLQTSHKDDKYNTVTLKRQNKIQVKDFPLESLNLDQPKVSTAKFNVLVSLCQSDTPLVRLDEHIAFSLSLPHD